MTLALEAARSRASSGWAWALYECGRMPFLALILGGVFIPYFATVVVGDPVRGQALVALFGTIAGVIAAVTAPIIGTSVDEFGARKPWIGWASFVLAVLVASLWWVTPSGPIAVIGAIVMLVAIKVIYGYTETLHNSMLVHAARGSSVSYLSSVSMAIGNFTAIVGVGFFAWAFTAPETPLFGLDPAAHEHVRIVGPFVGLLLAISTLPLLLWAQDAPPTAKPIGRALADSARAVLRLPRLLMSNGNAALYLSARMLYTDSIAALTIMAGVLSAGVLGWTPTELLLAGLGRTIGGVVGSLIGGVADAWVGPKRSIQVSLIVIIISMLGLVGTRPDTLFFFWSHEAAPGASGLFAGLPDLIHLTLGTILSTAIFVVTTSSRVLLIKITPPEQSGTYFGLYALSGSATAWLAPMLVGIATVVFANQQAGIAPLIALFAISFVLLLAVRPSMGPSARIAQGATT